MAPVRPTNWPKKSPKGQTATWTKVKRPRRASTQMDFALSGDMITREEFEACLDGNMALNDRGSSIMNLNLDHHSLKPGESTRLFHGRATQIQMNRLLGLTDDGKKPT